MNFRNLWKFSLLPAALLFSPAIHAQGAAQPVIPATSVAAGDARPPLWIATLPQGSVAAHGPGVTDANCAASICYYFPADMRTAYATGSIANGNGGSGITVAIVDAYYNPQTEADLAVFTNNALYPALPSCTSANGCLTIVSQTGGAPTATTNAGWAQETDLDVQWVHAMAPNAKILLVTADSPSYTNLFTALQYARAHADIVTNSYGSTEFAGQTSFDSILQGSTIPVVFSSGDKGGVVEYPCSSPSVTCVGGTRLTQTSTSFRNVESVWGNISGDGGTGGGCSTQESQPNFQAGFSDSVCGTHRGVPDISALADPNTGVLVYFGSTASSGNPGAYVLGGTSLAAPLTAGYLANVDAARIHAGKNRLGSNLNQLLYASTAAPYYHYRFYDVTVGVSADSTSTNASGFAATTGWDRATGLGVPLGPALAAYLLSTP